MRNIYFSLLIILSYFSLNAQVKVFKGIVTDSLQHPLEFANLMAKPISNNNPFVFAVTDEKGMFKMELQTKTRYNITVYYMGYQSYSFIVDTSKTLDFKKIQLYPLKQELNGVVINYQIPVKINSDSIVYEVKHFVDGSEYKLKALLNKLPGIRVDDYGKITVMGKTIDKVMVEGNDFFGGNSKLAVDNIPADAVKSVQVLKDYNRVSFMKGFSDKHKTIINIKLKEGKKRFVFGDLSAGSNVKQKYLTKANLFYYSPHTNLSYIGNFNNTGESSLTLQDISVFAKKNNFFEANVYKNHQDHLMQFLSSDDFLSKDVLFNALQWQQDLWKNCSVNTYSIFSKEKSFEKKLFENKYLIDTNVNQTQIENSWNTNKTNLSSIDIVFKPNPSQNYNLNFTINKSYLYFKRTLNNNFESTSQLFNTRHKNDDLNYLFTFSFHKRVSKKHTFRLLSEYYYDHFLPKDVWQSDNEFLSTYINWQTTSLFELTQRKMQKDYYWNNLLKYYYKINNHNHIYLSAGHVYDKTFYRSNLVESTKQKEVDIQGFINDVIVDTNDSYAGIQYRFRLKKHTFTPGIFTHYIYHLVKNHSDNSENYKKIICLPQFDYEGQVFHGDIELHYALKNKIPATSLFAKNKILSSFEQIIMGNPEMKYGLFHHLEIDYSYFSLNKGIMLFSNFDAKRKVSSIKYHSQISGTEVFNVPFISLLPENSIRFINRFEKKWKKWQITYNSLFVYSSTVDYVNDLTLKGQNYLYENGISIGVKYKKLPKLETGINWQYWLNKHSLKSTNTNGGSSFIKIQYHWKGLVLKSNYRIKIAYVDDVYHKIEDLLNFSVLYRPQDKALGFEFSIYNMLNQQFKYNYYPSSYLISQKYTYTFPRLFLLKLHYKI